MMTYRDSMCFGVLTVGVIFPFVLLLSSPKLHAQQTSSSVGTIGVADVPDYSAGDVPRSLIKRVLLNGPAYQAGLRPGDIIVRIDGAEVTATTMAPTLRKKAAGSNISITYLRNGVSQNVIVTLADRFPLYQKLAQTGDPFAECGLAYSYLDGLGVPKDQSEALKWLRKAADGGAESCQYGLGFAYAKGNGVDKDQAEALKWWRKAADQGFPWAEDALGTAYANGNGVNKDQAEGLRWWRKAADQGFPAAQYALGFAFATGGGVNKDQAEALKWWRKAADQGFPTAEYEIGTAYANGNGVNKDQAEALKWWRKAADHGETHAQYALSAASIASSGSPPEGADRDEAIEIAPQRALIGDSQSKQSLKARAILWRGFPAIKFEAANDWGSVIAAVTSNENAKPMLVFPVGLIPKGGQGLLCVQAARIFWLPADGSRSKDSEKLKAALNSPSANIEYKQGDEIFRVTFAAKHQDFVPVLGEFRRGRSDEEGLTEAIRAIVPQYVAWLKFGLADFGSADAKFRQLTEPLRLPRPEGESSQFFAEQSAGDVANEAGHLRDALQHYLTALRSLSKYPLLSLEQSLREKIIKVVAGLDPPPSIPEDAQRHAAYASVAIQQAGAPNGSPSDLDNCIDEWEEALRIAPWWPEAYYNVGLALEKRERFAEAARNLQFYLHAAPKAKDADTVQQRIYELEYRAKQERRSN